MALYGVYRISDQMRSNAMLSNVRSTDLDMSQVQQQISTGSRLQVPSDDPAAANGALTIQRILEQQKQQLTNIQNASNILNTTDSTLGDAGDLLLQADTIAQANVGSLATNDQRQAAAQQVDSLIDQMLSIANTNVGGVYIFGGTANTSAPFVSKPGGIQYVGSDQNGAALVGGLSAQAIGVTGDQAFGASDGVVRGYKDLSPALTATTRLSDVKGAGGQGIRLGSILIDDGTNQVQVDLTGADQIGQVIDKINQAATLCGSSITAQLGPNQNITISSGQAGADLKVSDLAGGHAAEDLGICRTTGQGDTFNGDSLHPRLTVMTKLSDISNGAGFDEADGIKFIINGKTVGVTFDDLTTVGAMLNRINGLDMGMQARINADGTGIDIVNTLSGTQMQVGENGGTTADDLGVRSLYAGTQLSDLNGGTGVHPLTDGSKDMSITTRSGVSMYFNVDGCQTVGDVLRMINVMAANAGLNLQAQFNTNGNGIAIIDNTAATGTLKVSNENNSTVATDLGICGASDTGAIKGPDVNPIAPGGVFAHLTALRDALLAGDSARITRADQQLAADRKNVVDLRAGMGGTVNDLTSRTQRTQDQQLANKSMLSTLKDTDMTSAITQFQALQTALQGNLTVGARMLSMSLLDFLK